MARILIVEDDKDLNAAYQVILKRAGHTVASALNGEQALGAAKEFQPDLILLDLLMPVMGGLAFLQAYDLDQHPDVKVVIFTNMENSPEVTQAYSLGVTRCIIKSWTAPQNLMRVVDDVLQPR